MSSSSESEEEKYDGMYYLTKYISLMREAINISETYLPNRKSSSNSMIKKYIASYDRITKAQTASFDLDHAPLFKEMFYANRDKFMNVCSDDSFLRTLGLQAWYGKNTAMKSKNIRLPISVCMSLAFQMREEKSKKLNEDPENDATVMGTTEYIIYGEMKYFLVFTVALSLDKGSIDREKLRDILEELRDDTTLEEGDEEVPGSSVGSILRTVTGMFGSKVNIGSEEMGNLEHTMESIMGDNDFKRDVEEAAMETRRDPNKTMGDCMRTVFDRVSPNITSLVEKHGTSVAPPGTLSVPTSETRS